MDVITLKISLIKAGLNRRIKLIVVLMVKWIIIRVVLIEG